MSMGAVIILSTLLLLVVSWAVGAYNRLVNLRKRLRHAFAQTDGELARRHDLVPVLLELAQGMTVQERDALIAARALAKAERTKAAADPGDGAAVQRMVAAEDALGTLLSRMRELYAAGTAPALMQLAEDWSGIENRIAFARQLYNDSAMQYNTSLEQFPGSVIARLFVFKIAPLLQPATLP